MIFCSPSIRVLETMDNVLESSMPDAAFNITEVGRAVYHTTRPNTHFQDQLESVERDEIL